MTIDSEKELAKVELEPVFSKDNIKDPHVVLSHVVSTNGNIVEVTGDVDEAMQFALNIDDVEFSEEQSRKLLRKIDFYLLPIICLVYCFQFVDKITSSAASIIGLRTHFDMVGDMYSWAGSSFYLGYIAFVFPFSALLQKYPVAKCVSVIIIIWGVLLCLHSVAANYPAFIALRTLLGAFESSVTPAMVIITGQWYKKEEQFLRTSIWISCNGIGILLGYSIAYGLAIHKDSYSIEPWKIMFIVPGCMTIFAGFLLLFHLPDVPVKAWFLTPLERKQVVMRIKTNQQGFGNKHFKWNQFKEAILDINTWLYFLLALASNIPNGALANFGAILMNETFGYSSLQSLLMNLPCGGTEFVGCILFAYCSKWVKQRMVVSFFAAIVTLVASCMLAFALDSPNARLAGYYLITLAPLIFICNLSCFSSNVAGHTKKITVNAIFLIGYCVGNLIGPQTFVSSQAPEYRGAQISIVVCFAVTLVLIAWIYINCFLENKRRDRLVAEGKITYPDIENIEFADLTDKENVFFRYQL